MKKLRILLAALFCTIFSIHVSASDSISVPPELVAPIVDTLLVVQRTVDLNVTEADSLKNAALPVKAKSLTTRKKLASSRENSDTVSSNTLLDYIQSYDLDAHRISPRPVRVFTSDDVLDELEMNPLYVPMILGSVQKKYSVRKEQVLQNPFKSAFLDSMQTINSSRKFVEDFIQDVVLFSEAKYIDRVQYDVHTLPQPDNLVFQLNSRQPAVWLRPTKEILEKKASTKDLPKTLYNPWTRKMVTKLQFSQTYNSPNWSKGGESNMAGLWTLTMEANYSNLKNVQFDNYMETKIGMNTVTTDSLRSMNISTDQIRANSKLGVRMHNDFYYSLSGEFTTQALNNYKANTMNLKSSFLSPAKLFVGLGVDYKKNDNKRKYNLSVLLTPLTVKMSYLYDNVNMKPKDFGIEEGDHLKSELGSKISATLTWRLSEDVQWRSNVYYYTDFTYVDTDWENTIDVNFNGLFTTSFYLHLKLDDRVKREPGEALIQMQELLSFGLSYKF